MLIPYDRMPRDGQSTLPELELLQVIALLHKAKRWSESVSPMVEYLRSYQAKEIAVRLKLAQILVEVAQRPRQATQVLTSLNPALLADKQRRTLEKLESKAQDLSQHVLQEPPVQEW